MGKIFTPSCLRVSLMLVVYVFLGQAAMAQIMRLSPSELKAQSRKNEKEAARYRAEQMETEPEVQQKGLRKGESGRQRDRIVEEPAEYVYDKEKNAIYDEPRPGKARSRKSKIK